MTYFPQCGGKVLVNACAGSKYNSNRDKNKMRRMANIPATMTPIAPKAPGMSAAPGEQPMTDDTIFCLCCGKGFKMLKRHLGAEHGLTEAEYRVMFNLAADAPLVAPSYSKRKAEYAKRAGLGKYSRDKSDNNAELS